MGLCRTHIDFYVLEFQQSLCNFAVKMSPGNVPSPLSLSSAFIHGGKSLSPNAVSMQRNRLNPTQVRVSTQKETLKSPGERGRLGFVSVFGAAEAEQVQDSGELRVTEEPRTRHGRAGDPPRWLQRDSWFGGAALTHCEGFDSSGTWQITPAEGTQASE